MEALIKGISMESLASVIETWQKIQLPVSFHLILVILAVFGVSFYFRKFKIGLVATFLAVSYWGFTSNEELLLELARGSFYGMLVSIAVALAVAFVSFVGVIQDTN